MRPLLENLAGGRQRSAISRGDATGRAGAARMGRHAQSGGVGGMADAAHRRAKSSYAWGPLSALGVGIAIATGIADQASKFWLLDAFDLPERGRAALTPFLDLVLIWNAGI